MEMTSVVRLIVQIKSSPLTVMVINNYFINENRPVSLKTMHIYVIWI